MLLSLRASVRGFNMKMSCTVYILIAKCHPCSQVVLLDSIFVCFVIPLGLFTTFSSRIPSTNCFWEFSSSSLCKSSRSSYQKPFFCSLYKSSRSCFQESFRNSSANPPQGFFWKSLRNSFQESCCSSFQQFSKSSFRIDLIPLGVGKNRQN